jgi:hypothetical protein
MAYTKRNYPPPNLSLFNRERIIEYLHGTVPKQESMVEVLEIDLSRIGRTIDSFITTKTYQEKN